MASLVTPRPPDLLKFLSLGSGDLGGCGNGFRSFGTFTGPGSRLRMFGAFTCSSGGCGWSSLGSGCGLRFNIRHALSLGIRRRGFRRGDRLILASLCGLGTQWPFL
jgi:hypothetical protein